MRVKHDDSTLACPSEPFQAGFTRRELLARIGAAAVALPADKKRKKRKPVSSRQPMKPPVVVGDRRILMVTDGGPGGRLHATFAPGIQPADDGLSGDFFGFSELIRTLSAVPGVTVLRAHRDIDPSTTGPLTDADRTMFGATFERFRFDATDLSGFDQIWLLGVGSLPDTAPIDDNELLALASFMNSGGGVFATGDHGDIGQPLCGRLLRVRSMRTWWTKNAPDNEPTAPDPIGATRIDSVQFGADETRTSPDFRFNDQSDDRPAPIMITAAGTAHRALDLGGGRRLATLPDHMHEGIVFDPFDPSVRMSSTITYRGAAVVTHVEYPLSALGAQPRPQVLALGTALGGHSTISTEPSHIGTAIATVAGDRTYGALGAYDGHAAGVGRVFVTSTFHQLADINLIGDPRAVDRNLVPDPARRLGFMASAEGQQHLADQRQFWRSIVSWLSRPVH